MQLLAPIAWLRARLFGVRRPVTDAAVAWALAPPGPRAQPSPRAGASRGRWFRRSLGAALALEILLVTGLASAAWAVWPDTEEGPTTDEQIWYEALHDSWCRALPTPGSLLGAD